MLLVLVAVIVASIATLVRIAPDAQGVAGGRIVAGSHVAVKTGVQTEGVQPVMSEAIDAARRQGLAPVVTSAFRPGDQGSRHAQGLALDFRSRHLTPTERQEIAQALRLDLGQHWDVIAESNPPHFHVEYNPQ